jgi:hypothetical protein
MQEVITISLERLRELEALEASIPTMIEKAIVEYKQSNLKKLHERDKANPAAINMRVKRYVERHREEINRKRREKRQQLKLMKQTPTIAADSSDNVLVDLSENDEKPVKVESIFVRAATDAISKSDKPIVRKQYKKRSETTGHDTAMSTIIQSVPDRFHDVMVRFDT